MLDLNQRQFLNVLSSDWDFSLHDAEQFSTELIEVMTNNKGIGLAANQVGLDLRSFAIGSGDMDYFKIPTVVFNPNIIAIGKETELYKEGCLSFPDLWIEVKRPKQISVEYFDSKGLKKNCELTGLDARCFQHEHDHLNGVCFVDKVSKLKLQLAMKKMRKYKNDRT